MAQTVLRMSLKLLLLLRDGVGDSAQSSCIGVGLVDRAQSWQALRTEESNLLYSEELLE
jgi:hypothetical protein